MKWKDKIELTRYTLSLEILQDADNNLGSFVSYIRFDEDACIKKE